MIDVERLRHLAAFVEDHGIGVGDHSDAPFIREVAEELVTLRERVKALEAALEPFAGEVKTLQPWQGADGWDGSIDDCPLHLFSRSWHGNVGPTVGDCRRALALLSEAPPS